jgi:NTP pyrophosphatase (non-canonical NTP hydrolase)
MAERGTPTPPEQVEPLDAAVENLHKDVVVVTDIRELQTLAHDNAVAKGFHNYGHELRQRLQHAQERLEFVEGVMDDDTVEMVRSDVAFLEGSWTRYVGNAIALIIGEASEAHEEARKGRGVNETYYSMKYDANTDLSTAVAKPEGFVSELVDLLIRTLDTAEEFGIDLAAETALKMRYNASRPAMHGGKVM